MSTHTVRVVGVKFPNAGGSPRQEVIAGLSIGAPVLLRREPENQHDPHAMAVLTVPDGEHIGYLPAALAAAMTDVPPAGIKAKVSALFGGSPEKPSRGLEISYER